MLAGVAVARLLTTVQLTVHVPRLALGQELPTCIDDLRTDLDVTSVKCRSPQPLAMGVTYQR